MALGGPPPRRPDYGLVKRLDREGHSCERITWSSTLAERAASAVRKRIGVVSERAVARILAAVSNPSIVGIRKSSRIAAKSDCATRSHASSPESDRCRPTPSGSSTAPNASRLAGVSSTRRTLTGVDVLHWMSSLHDPAPTTRRSGILHGGPVACASRARNGRLEVAQGRDAAAAIGESKSTRVDMAIVDLGLPDGVITKSARFRAPRQHNSIHPLPHMSLA